MSRHHSGSWIERLLLALGVLGLAIFGVIWFGGDIWREWQNRQFDNALENKERPVESPQPEPDHSPAKPSHVAPAPGAVRRLSIPRLGIRSVVEEGDNDGVLSASLGHIPGTSLPGEPGNMGVAGHRDRLFRGLRNVARHDNIVLQTLDNNYVYEVESTEIVNPSDVGVLRPGGTSELTLVTCYPFYYIGSAPQRFIVKAKLVSSDAPSEAMAAQTVAVAGGVPARLAPRTKPRPAIPAITRVRAPRPLEYVAPEAESDNRTHNRSETHVVKFMIRAGTGREVVPGKVWFGISGVDETDRSVDGWVRMMPSQKTVWLRRQAISEPMLLSDETGDFELFVTSLTDTSASGYVIVKGQRSL